MTRADAKMVAEELYKLFEKNGFKPKQLITERYMGTKEAAEMLGMPLQTLYKKIDQIPHVKNGKRHVFCESSLREYINNL